MKRRFLDVVYEDKDLIVINKPRGVIVAHEKGSEWSGKKQLALVDHVRAYIVRKFPGAKASFARPLHRLDKETTGLVLFAKSNGALKLANDIKEHKVERVYAAIVEGPVNREDGTIDTELSKGDFGHGKKVGVVKNGEGKRTVTRYHVVERYDNATLLDARLETGFTHQIRVHLASIGHPLVGDKVYNPHPKIKFPRQALHARRVKFYHPVSKKKMILEAKLPPDMEGLVDNLRGN